MGWLVVVAALLVAGVGTARAKVRCDVRPAVGGGTISTCHVVGSDAPARQFRTRPAVGGTITTGGGRTCSSRPAVGGGVTTTCR
jgi:hypothetical protein